MLRIACCDDNTIDRDWVLNIIMCIEEKWKEKFEIFSFDSGEDLCKNIVKLQCNVVVLGILMDKMDGIEVAKKISETSVDCFYIFISKSKIRIKELFQFKTIGFIDKPCTVEELEINLLNIYKILKKEKEHYFEFSKNGTVQYISIQDILFFESDRNEIILHTQNLEIKFYDTIHAIWLRLKSTEQFIMPHRSFIVNLHHLDMIQDRVILKKNGFTINIGKTFREDTQGRYLKYIENKII